MSLIRLDNVSKFYKSGEGVSVGMRKVTTSFNYGEFVAVTGESGSGKSTLLNVISGLDSYEDGELYIENDETSHFTNKEWEAYRSKYIGFIFQSYNIIDSFTVYQNVLLALEIQNYPKHLRKKRALELIDKVGLSSHIHHKAAKLSGGQKQRTVIARALAKDCPIIVADEPTGNLDSESGKQVIDLLHEISKEKLVVIVTHEFDQVKAYATRRIKMHDGEIVEDKILKKVESLENIDKQLQKGMSFWSVLHFAIRNILATPRRTFFILLFQILIMSIFIFGYTLLMFSARNQNQFEFSPIGDNNVNFGIKTNITSDNRFYVMKKDQSSLTQQDYDQLNNISGGDYYLYKDLTYIDTNGLEILYVVNDDDNDWYRQGISNARFDSTYSIENNPQFLKEGRLPLLDNEIVISNSYENYIYLDTVLEYQKEIPVLVESEHTRFGNLVTIPIPDDIEVNHYGYVVNLEGNESVEFISWNNEINLTSYTSDPSKIVAIETYYVYTTIEKDRFTVVGIYNDNF
ncbi:MAG TPA: ABC transporter ATP-binding protein, partial [Acholeplasma sp.]|nr:ABC transporter ATP-binding protein [Acholeplasma sp.]